MSNAHHISTGHKQEHGSVKSYVVGFILSIIFTLIPYYLVVNQTIKGSVLLWVIMAFAVAQAIIQITFFLHLGRGPKPNWNFFFFISTVGIILVVVGGSIIIINNLHYNMKPSDQVNKLINDEGIYQVGGQKTGACQAIETNHTIVITDRLVIPSSTQANKCDSLTFINENDTSITILFGEKTKKQVYAGLTEIKLKSSKSKTITLSETGTYKLFVPNNPALTGSFTVE